MVHIGLRQILLQKIQKRQQHGAHSPKKIRKRQITVFFHVNPLNHIEKVTGHKNIQRAGKAAAVTENGSQLPNIQRPAANNQFIDGLPFFYRQDIFPHAAGILIEYFIQKFFLHTFQVRRKFVLKCTAVFGLCSYGIDKKLMLGKPLNQHLAP